jgi:hypothetical protein
MPQVVRTTGRDTVRHATDTIVDLVADLVAVARRDRAVGLTTGLVPTGQTPKGSLQ